MKRRIAFLAALGFAVMASAQPPAPGVATAPPAPVPLIDRASALHGSALVEALRKGGYVLFMRHARQGGPQNEAPCTQANLVTEGVAQARKVAAALHELRIPIGAVRASRQCRAIETARLLDVGEVEITQDLNPGIDATPELHGARLKRLAEMPPSGGNTLLVSHGQASSREAEKLQLELAEIVVYRPDGKGGTMPLARIKLEDWDALR